jgi:hypothetical protein
MLALDWSDGARYVAKVIDHIGRSLEPDLVVAWIHDDGVARRLLEDLSAEATAYDFFHIVGSSRENPIGVAARLRTQIGELGAVRYHQVILGARADGHPVRWLTHAEISAGVIEAIEIRAPLHVVGRVRA